MTLPRNSCKERMTIRPPTNLVPPLSSTCSPKKPRQSGEESDGTFSDSDAEEDFYYEEIYEEPIPTSPPTLSHRDMARPPHEDPEYQMQVVLAHQNQYNNTIKPPLPIGSSPYSSSWSHKSQVSVQRRRRQEGQGSSNSLLSCCPPPSCRNTFGSRLVRPRRIRRTRRGCPMD